MLFTYEGIKLKFSDIFENAGLRDLEQTNFVASWVNGLISQKPKLWMTNHNHKGTIKTL